MNSCAKMFAIAAAFAVSASSSYAVDYLLEAGQTDTISTNVVYEKMTILGDLTVNGAAKITTPRVDMTNGSVTVTDKRTKLGSGHKTDSTPTTWHLYPDESGKYGRIYVKDCREWSYGPSAKWLYLREENEAAAAEGGYIDFLRLENGGMPLRRTFNMSSLTGRITVAGSGGAIYREASRSSDDRSIFASNKDYKNGGYRIEMEDGADLLIHVSNQGGRLNDAGCRVDVVGNADVEIEGGYNSSYPFELNKGAVFNHNGFIKFTRCGQYNCCFDLNDSDVIGANVSNIIQNSGSSTYSTSVRIAAGATVTVNDLTLTGTGTRLVAKGDGARIKVNASTGDRTFKARIMSGDALVVEKTGSHEMIVASPTTNFSHLVVSEGVVRITADCVIENLKMADGALLVADGCRVTLSGETVGASLATANGGRFVNGSAQRTMFYDPRAISGLLHLSGGENVFSRYGFNQKWWRWTITEVQNGPYPLRIRGFYLFDADGSLANKSLSRTTTATEATTSILPKGYYRLRCHSTTNFTHSADAQSYQKESYSHNWFHVKNNGNNYFKAGSPVINPDDAHSSVILEMCLNDNAKPVTGYNIRKAHESGTGAPRTWTVEVSDNGLDWSVVDRQEDVPVPSVDNTAYYTYDGTPYVNDSYNAKELFHFTGYRSDGLTAMSSPLALQADGGAVVDLRAFTGGQSIDALTVDCSAGTGKIFGAKIAESGVLTIANADALPEDLTLPLTLPESIDGANMKNWSVIVDGVAKKLRAKLMPDGTLRLMDKGTVIILR